MHKGAQSERRKHARMKRNESVEPGQFDRELEMLAKLLLDIYLDGQTRDSAQRDENHGFDGLESQQ